MTPSEERERVLFYSPGTTPPAPCPRPRCRNYSPQLDGSTLPDALRRISQAPGVDATRVNY
jgi:hypothetical protein